jgi:hypothetical protein
MTGKAGAVNTLTARDIAWLGRCSAAGEQKHCDRKGQDAVHRQSPLISSVVFRALKR